MGNLQLLKLSSLIGMGVRGLGTPGPSSEGVWGAGDVLQLQVSQ